MTAPGASSPRLSVVIPAYNSAPWIPSTLVALAEAIRRAELEVETIVVDDGSTDETAAVANDLNKKFPGGIRVLSQDNAGRYSARLAGVRLARAPYVLLLDSRVLIRPGALRYAFDRQGRSGHRAWNAHIDIDTTAPLVGRFWDVPTYIFWGDYLRHPRPYDLTADNFDSAPKGTTMFLAERELLLDAFATADIDADAKLVSDDTAVLRALASIASIRLDPGFAAVYRPRTTTRSFIAHSFDRGTLFVDSYGGTSAVRSGIIIGAVVAPLALVAVLLGFMTLGWWTAAFGTAAVCIMLALSPMVPAALNKCPPRSLLAYAVVLPVFVGPFWAGLARGIVLHRRVFRGRTPRRREKEPS